MQILRAALLSILLIATAHAETIRVGAAVSLKDALTQIAKTYEASSGDHIEFTFGSSGQISAQIKSGAEVDLFISAANKQVDDLAKDKLIEADSRRVIVGNALVLIVPAAAKQAPDRFEALTDASVTKIAIGEPKTVPAGQYAEQVFRSLKLTDTIAKKMVYGTNVRQVLSYVESGEVSAGVVYATDAKQFGDNVRIVATADDKMHEPIVYPAVIVSASTKRDAAKRFLNYLTATEAQATFHASGFVIPPATP